MDVPSRILAERWLQWIYAASRTLHTLYYPDFHFLQMKYL